MDGHDRDNRITHRHTWRAGCAETRTSGSVGGLRKRARSKDWNRAAGRPNHIIHHGHWTVRLAADGLPEFIPPTYVDPQQRPRRNLYHRRT